VRRLGLRASASLFAMVAVTMAVIVGTAILLTTLRQSLVNEIDRSNLSRVDDITSQWDSENELIVLGAGFDQRDTPEDDRIRAIAVLATEPEFISDSPPQLAPDESVVFVGSSLEPVDATVLQVLIGATIIGPLFVLLVGVLTWFLTGRSLRSVEAIRSEVENISSVGLDRRVPEPNPTDGGRAVITRTSRCGSVIDCSRGSFNAVSRRP
jgi:two-component system OmpR family sensor kinase